MIFSNPRFRPFLYMVFFIAICALFQLYTPRHDEPPAKVISFSRLKTAPVNRTTIMPQPAMVDEHAQTSTENLSDSIALAQLVHDFLKMNRHKSENPVIRYYTKPLDNRVVYRLNDFGFYVHERTNNNLQEFKSNVLHYGDSVSLDEIKIITYVLLTGGLDIKEIAPSKYHAGWKYNSVEIGADTTLQKSPSITFGYLNNLKLVE